MPWLAAIRTRLQRLIARDAAESRMNQEFALHIELETEKLMREPGLAPEEARRRALAAFGGVEKHKEALRDGRGLAWLGGFSLDLKLAARMLARYPVLTLVGGAAMAFGIGAGVGAFEIRTQLIDPRLPLDEGDRVVGVRYWHASDNAPVLPTSHDVAVWREQLGLIEDLSAFTSFSRNVGTSDGGSEVEAVAAMSPSAFRVVRVPLLLGRALLDSDALPGAPPVVVISHDIWSRRLARDPGVVGRTVRLGREEATVVGVMPEGFVFPAAHHLWVPLREPAGLAAADGPELLVFGRLAAGASREQAQAELSAIGARLAAASPRRHEFLRPQLVPFTWLMFDPGGLRLGVALGNIFVVMLLVLVSANVALLMFARAATRETEIAVRSALGADRARIVAQLFVEALLLSVLAVAVGLIAARFGLRSFLVMFEADSGRALPFWVSDSLTTTTVIYAGALTVVAASIIGVLPALNVTRRDLQDRLRQSSAGGGGYRFSGVWTAVIAGQVAATLMFPAAAFFFHRWVVAGQTRDVGFPSGQFLSARLELDRERTPGVPVDPTDEAFRSRMASTWAELERRLSADSQVTGLSFADRLPGTLHPRWRIDVDGEAPPLASPTGHRVSSASVAVNFFDVIGAPILAGRPFAAADLEPDPGVVIVNRSFVDRVLGGRNPIGRRIRRSPRASEEAPGPWLEIVGVVRDLGMLEESAGLYRPVPPERASVLRMAIGTKDEPQLLASRVRAVANEVEPALQLHELMPLDEAGASTWLESQYLSRLLTVLSAIALLLSLTAIYSVTAFTVSRRTREIGIRVALGADRRRVIAAILRRPLAQVGLGVFVGGILVGIVFVGLYETPPTAAQALLIATYAVAMVAVCLLACVVPARRALAVDPARALSVDT
jgi:predicted permease